MISSTFNKSCSKPEKPDHVPFSLRLSNEEREALKIRAKNKTVSAYIREQLFGHEQTPRQYNLRRPSEDKQLLAKAMGELGKSRLSSNMNQIAKAANVGALPVTSELEQDLVHACEAIQQMRALLIRALGLSPGPGVR